MEVRVENVEYIKFKELNVGDVFKFPEFIDSADVYLKVVRDGYGDGFSGFDAVCLRDMKLVNIADSKGVIPYDLTLTIKPRIKED